MDIAKVFADLKAYQKVMGYDFEIMPWPKRVAVLRDYVTALHVEQAELLDELPWKPWKTYEDNCYANLPSKAVDEWMDCFVFLIDQALCLQLNAEDIERSYERTMAKNYERVASGYSKIQKEKTL